MSTAAPTGERQDLPPYKQARRAQILRAALAALKAHDYEQIQMRTVAESADVALGTLYRYFTSKEHLYAAVLMEWAQPVLVDVGAGPPPGEARIREKVRGVIASFERRPALFKLILLLQNTADDNASRIMAEFAESAQRSLAHDFGSLGPQESADTAIMLWGIINTMLTAALLRDHPMADTYRVADAFIDLVALRLPVEQRA